MLLKKIVVQVLLCVLSYSSVAQVFVTTDSILASDKPVTKLDTSFNPKIAIRRSAMLPGWGQITNKQSWKLPLVYGSLGTTGYFFFRNLKDYKESRDAYALATDGDVTNDDQIKEPYFSVKDRPQVIQAYRNSVRQNVDYSVLVFIAFWGLQVADAAVSAHLKMFDVDDNLGYYIKPSFDAANNTAGLSLVIPLGRK